MSTCSGCNALLGMPELAELLGESLNTLYKWSRRGYPGFPKASRLPNRRIVVKCRDARVWLDERSS